MNMRGFPGYSFFLDHHCLLSAFEASSGSNTKHGLSGLSVVSAYSAADITHLFVLAVSPTELPCITDPPGFCFHWASMKLYTNGMARNSGGHSSSAPVHALFSYQSSLTKHKFRGKTCY